MPAQTLAPTNHIQIRDDFVSNLRTLAMDLAYPIVADRRLAEQILFYQQMAMLVAAGIPLVQAIRLRVERTTGGHLKEILQESLRHSESGGRLSEVFARHPETIPPFQVAVLYAGETGGRLEEALAQIADCLEAEQRLRRFINKQMAYAKILYFIIQFAIPAFFAFVMGGSVLAVIWFGIQSLATMVVMLCVLFAVGRGAMSRLPEAALTYEQVKWALPGLGRIAREFALCRFGRAVAALYSAGVPAQQALRLSGPASGSKLLTRASDAMAGYVDHGVSLGEACRATCFFPSRTVEMLATGAETGNVDSMMTRMADYLEDEAETHAQQAGYLAAQVFYLLVVLTATGIAQGLVGALIGALTRHSLGG